MFGLIARAALFAVLIAAICLGLLGLQRVVGDVSLTAAGHVYTVPAWVAVVAFVTGVAVLYALIRLVRLALVGRRLLRARTRAAQTRRGRTALAQAIVALEAEDGAAAAREALLAERLLDDPHLTGLVTARALRLSGDGPAATQRLRALLAFDETADVARAGLLTTATDAAAIARWATEARTAGRPVALRAAFMMEVRTGQWAGALDTALTMENAGMIAAPAAARRRAVLTTALAQQARERGETYRALDLAQRALVDAPDLTPAATLAAMLLIEKGRRTEAESCLLAAWSAAPHPDLAAAGAAIVPDERIDERRARFAPLLARNPAHRESRILAAELALADGDPAAARAALGLLDPERDDVRFAMLHAAAASALGAPERETRGWLARAATAAPAPVWRCDACAAPAPAWRAACAACGAFDAIGWSSPTARGVGRVPPLLPALEPILINRAS